MCGLFYALFSRRVCYNTSYSAEVPIEVNWSPPCQFGSLSVPRERGGGGQSHGRDSCQLIHGQPAGLPPAGQSAAVQQSAVL